MTAKTIILAAVLAALPALSYASCSGRGHQAQSCAAGFAWDSNLQTCVKQVST